MKTLYTRLILIFSAILTLFTCNKFVQRSGQIDNSTFDEDYTIREIQMDSFCIEKVKTYISEKYQYSTNTHKCLETKKMKKVIFLTNDEKSENGFSVLKEEGVYVRLKDNCEIDTVIFSRLQNRK